MEQRGSPVRIAVVGAGAIGGLLAAFAREAGHEVVLCVRTPLHELTVRSGGQVLRPDLEFATDPAGQPPADWVLLTTKAQDTDGARDWLDALCGPGTTVAVVQNGVEHEERVGPLLPPGTRLLPTLAYIAAERTAPGHLVHHHAHQLLVPEGESADRFAELLAPSRLSVEPVADFRTAAWRKLLANVVANPVTALLQQRMHVFHDPEMYAATRDILRETAAVARAEGARIGADDVEEVLRLYTSVPPDGGSSMLYDRLAGRPLEHEHITGAVVRAAERHGVEAPLNRLLLTLLRAVDREIRGETAQPG